MAFNPMGWRVSRIGRHRDSKLSYDCANGGSSYELVVLRACLTTELGVADGKLVGETAT
jgi:hypothetical protein